MFAVRDRYGIRPLCIGKDKHNFYVSSESCAFGSHIDFIRDVKPGELVRIDKNGIHQVYLHPKKSIAKATIRTGSFMTNVVPLIVVSNAIRL